MEINKKDLRCAGYIQSKGVFGETATELKRNRCDR